MRRLRAQVRDRVAHALSCDPIDVVVEVPRDTANGDLAVPCFKFGGNPAETAQRLADLWENDDHASASAAGPFLNVTFDRPAWAGDLVPLVLGEGRRYGADESGAGKTAVIDFSSPNIAKPFSVGHLRSTVIGAAIGRLLRFRGWTVQGINHLGDWGSQFGKMLAAWERWGEDDALADRGVHHLLDLYVRYHEIEETDEDLRTLARTRQIALEQDPEGDERALWRRFTEISLAEFQRVYDRLDVSFEFTRGESHYIPELPAAMERLQEARIVSRSQGALIVDLGDDMPPCLLETADGTTLYATRDLAAIFSRWDEFKFDEALYVVGSEQRLHFRQLAEVLEQGSFEAAGRIRHIDFGLIRGLSTRLGKVVFLDEVLDRAVQRVATLIAEKNPDLPLLDEIAEQVGIGAVVFHDLKHQRIKDADFDWDRVLDFEGDTGPYCQYTHARLSSILAKAVAEPDLVAADWAALGECGAVLAGIEGLGEAVDAAVSGHEPSVVAGWCLALCRDVNGWYHAHRVLDQEPSVTAARLGLVAAARQALANGLGLLGVASPEAM